MAAEDLELRLKKEAKNSLQVFKDQSLLRRRFGDDAVKLYNSCEGAKTASQLMEELGMDEQTFVSILEFMNNNGMVSVSQDPGEKISPPGSSITPPLVPPTPSRSSITPPSPSRSFSTTPPASSRSSLSPPNLSRSSSITSPRTPSSYSPPPRTPSSYPPPPKAPPEGEKEEEEVLADKQGEEEGIEERLSVRGRQRELPSLARSEGTTDVDVGLLSPLEKVLYEKHGEIGVQIYNLIDGEKTAEEILKQTGVSESKLVEILEFMDEQGIIKLEKPPSAESESPDEKMSDAPEEKKPEPSREPRFKPIIEEEPEEKPFIPPTAPAKVAQEQKKEEEEEADELLVPVDVPAMAKLSLAQRAVLFADLATKFGKNAQELFKQIDGKHDFVELCLSSSLSFFDIDTILAYFGKKGFVTFRQLTRDEIKKRYGEDGFAIFKRYGRDGLLLYEMIGKEASMKDIIVKSKLDPNRAIDIFVFIHKVLGLDIPLEKNIIYRQLGLKK